MSHFTYDASPKADHLFQGDILQRTPYLEQLLKEIHPHYTKSDYKYYIVLSQSCDLVYRDAKECKTKYITLAAVRPLSTVIDREIQKYQTSPAEIKGKCVDKKMEDRLKGFLRSLLNNNNSDYFYLHQDVSVNLNDSCVAFLKLSVAIKAGLHYQECLKARVFGLNPNFRAKLGWLVGNIYSRIGTDDWAPDYKTDDEFSQMIEELLRSHCIFIDEKKKVITKLNEMYTEGQLEGMDIDTLQKELKNIKIPTKRDQLGGALQQVLKQVKYLPDEAAVKGVTNSILNDPVISQLLK